MNIHIIPRSSMITHDIMKDLPNYSDFLRNQVKIMIKENMDEGDVKDYQKYIARRNHIASIREELFQFNEDSTQFLSTITGLWCRKYWTMEEQGDIAALFSMQHGHGIEPGEQLYRVLIFYFEQSQDREKFVSEFLVMRKLSI